MKFFVVDLECWKNSFHLVGKKQETKSYIWIRIRVDQILIIFYVFKISYFSYFFNYVSILPNPPTHYVSKHKHLTKPTHPLFWLRNIWMVPNPIIVLIMGIRAIFMVFEYCAGCRYKLCWYLFMDNFENLLIRSKFCFFVWRLLIKGNA